VLLVDGLENRRDHTSQYAMGDIAFSLAERDRHLGIRPVSQLNTWPVVSPVNASRRPSRDAAHHSGLGRLPRPFPWRTFTSYSLPAYLAHSALGQFETKNNVRDDSSLSQKRSPGARHGCASPGRAASGGRRRLALTYLRKGSSPAWAE